MAYYNRAGYGCTSMDTAHPYAAARQSASTKIEHLPLAMSYVPWQHFEELYPPSKALCEGTAFPELNKIFCGVRG